MYQCHINMTVLNVLSNKCHMDSAYTEGIVSFLYQLQLQALSDGFRFRHEFLSPEIISQI